MTKPFSGAVPLLPSRQHRARRLAIVLMAIAPLLFGGLAVALGQDCNWDLRNYHWYNGYALLNGRYAIDLLPSQTPWFYNPALDAPFYLLATHVPAVVAGFVLGAVQGLNFILLFMLAYAGLTIANPRQKVIVSAALAALGMLGGGGIALIGTTFYDNVTSLGLFLSAVLVVRFHDRLMAKEGPKAFGLAVACGFPAGMAMGLKLPCFTFCFGLCVALLLTGGSRYRRLLAAFGFGTGILAGVALTLGPWAWHLQSRFGSPLFPYFNQFFQSPLIPPASGRDLEYVPHGLHDILLFPFLFADNPFRAGEIPWRDWRIPILYALLPLAVALRLMFGRSRHGHDTVSAPVVTRYLLWSAVLSYFAWAIMFGIYRYLVPLEMLAPLLIVFAAGLLPVKPSARALLAAFILVAVAVSVRPGDWGRRPWMDRYVEADLPALGDTSGTMLLMAGYEPYAHIVTQFPPGMPVVRIQSNFISPDQDKAFNRLIHARVDAHRGSFDILIPGWQHQAAAGALAAFRLAADWKACQTVKDRLYDGTVYDLCPVSRSNE